MSNTDEAFRRCGNCGHAWIDHIPENDRGVDGCQVDLMTPDGPEMCGCPFFAEPFTRLKK